MTREEYEKKRNDLFRQIAELEERYVAENTEILPGTMVVAEGIIKDYTVANVRIYPDLFKKE